MGAHVWEREAKFGHEWIMGTMDKIFVEKSIGCTSKRMNEIQQRMDRLQGKVWGKPCLCELKVSLGCVGFRF